MSQWSRMLEGRGVEIGGPFLECTHTNILFWTALSYANVLVHTNSYHFPWSSLSPGVEADSNFLSSRIWSDRTAWYLMLPSRSNTSICLNLHYLVYTQDISGSWHVLMTLTCTAIINVFEPAHMCIYNFPNHDNLQANSSIIICYCFISSSFWKNSN